MTDPLLPDIDGATAVHPDDREALIPSYIATRAELNEAEQRNIAEARAHWMRRKLVPTTLLDDVTLRRLHEDMFAKVWKWAGQYRQRELSIGIDPTQVSAGVRNLTENAKVWLESGRDVDESVAHFHHQLVWIHPFVNGNGRHARLAADLLLSSLGKPTFTWGAGQPLEDPEAARRQYIEALRTADEGDLSALVTFVRS